MFEYIRGKLVNASIGKAVVDVGGVGYRVLIPLSTYSRLPHINQEVFFFISPVIREDAHILYGFLTEEERSLFEKFKSVSGVGPKTAATLIGHIQASDLQEAIANGNFALLSKIPGIGKKTAERIVVEMRDKIGANGPASQASIIFESGGVIKDAISALVNLGYSPLQAQKAVKQAAEISGDTDLSRVITAALKSI